MDSWLVGINATAAISAAVVWAALAWVFYERRRHLWAHVLMLASLSLLVVGGAFLYELFRPEFDLGSFLRPFVPAFIGLPALFGYLLIRESQRTARSVVAVVQFLEGKSGDKDEASA